MVGSPLQGGPIFVESHVNRHKGDEFVSRSVTCGGPGLEGVACRVVAAVKAGHAPVRIP